MTTFNRFLWGGLGGLAPILATFVILEGDTIARYLEDIQRGGSTMTIVGYSVRVIGLFVIGGLWAGLHKSEIDPKKLFQLGIVAPAMITGMISASNINAGDTVEVARAETPAAVERAAPAAVERAAPPSADAQISTRSTVRARETPQTNRPPPDPEPIKSFIRGLLGR